MKAYIVRNVHDVNHAIEKLENALLRNNIHFLKVERIEGKRNWLKVTVLDMRQAKITDIEFLTIPSNGTVKFYERKGA